MYGSGRQAERNSKIVFYCAKMNKMLRHLLSCLCQHLASVRPKKPKNDDLMKDWSMQGGRPQTLHVTGLSEVASFSEQSRLVYAASL